MLLNKWSLAFKSMQLERLGRPRPRICLLCCTWITALVQQIMGDPELLALDDAFYFEHHVTGSPMQWKAWGNLSTNRAQLGDIQDSYELFSFLISKGVRAHSWV